MSSFAIDSQVFRDPSWRHWTATIPLVALALAGSSWATAAAMLLCAVAAVYYWVQLQRLRPFPVQLPLIYLVLLGVGTLPWMQWIDWVRLVGTTAMVTTGYCGLIRMLSLAPLNRTEPLTPSFLWRVFFRQPCSGGLVRWSADSAAPAAGSCSLANNGPLACSPRARGI
jgi:hypothetical protein